MSTNSRSLDDAKAKRDLLDGYIAECDRIERYKAHCEIAGPIPMGDFDILDSERIEVFEHRRDRLYNELTNKGIKLHSDAVDTLPSIARAQASQGEQA
jgi:hypothetical protein